MKHKTNNTYLLIGSLLFGLFFGAGNLIFPVTLGQEAGANVWLTNLGFLITGIGLPLLGIIAMAVSNVESVFQLANQVNRRFAYAFTVLLYLVIGPFFAIPRLATTSYEIAVAPFVSPAANKIVLAIYSIVFFLLAWLAARKPKNLLTIIGKVLTPTLLILLCSLFIFNFINPLADSSQVAVQGPYQSQPITVGFIEGYNTLDALAALAFGIIVVHSLQELGIHDKVTMTRDIIISGLIGVGLMGVIYTLLARLGAESMALVDQPSTNGGQALAMIAQYYLGDIGLLLLGLTVLIACFKTSIGLLTAFSETFVDMFPRLSYASCLLIATILPTLFSNFGLNMIISLSLPVLMFIYPLAIVLILLSIISAFLPLNHLVFQWAMVLTGLAAIFDSLKVMEFSWLLANPLYQSLLSFAEQFLPFFNLGLGWTLPALLGILLGFFFSRKHG